jgi:hypothetical protein
MLTVLIIYKDGTDDMRNVLDVSDICLDGVLEIKVLRQEKAA